MYPAPSHFGCLCVCAFGFRQATTGIHSLISATQRSRLLSPRTGLESMKATSSRIGFVYSSFLVPFLVQFANGGSDSSGSSGIGGGVGIGGEGVGGNYGNSGSHGFDFGSGTQTTLFFKFQ